MDRELILRALDAALDAQVRALYATLVLNHIAGDAAAMDKFRVGLTAASTCWGAARGAVPA